MKIGGQTVQGKHRVVVPIIRETPHYFVLGPVTDTAEFYEKYPEPTPPMIHNVALDTDEADYSSPKYQTQRLEYTGRFLDWLAIHSIKAGAFGATGVEQPVTWDTVDMDDPTTYKNWKQELQDSDHTESEINRLVDGVMEVNSLSAAMVESARNDFLRGREEAELAASRRIAPDSTESGEPASASDSGLPE
jgi:hypothetical protein